MRARATLTILVDCNVQRIHEALRLVLGNDDGAVRVREVRVVLDLRRVGKDDASTLPPHNLRIRTRL